ncbi:PLP-dependent cysteine synthase family protein [Desulfosporosinus sp. BICA1-9]|uniref:PLP-dependent cysteine synthase family protein n=1 Tax=Desulfosporosinus sp. BICA1-9 TaxID=1531958 RepID=UPI00054B8615|nr:cysteine synthase family protein [Desulfosporosinus sp. BICA1-9]KJS49910.1 MAG: cysteine synthase [Peptococcaceae bacterium BRH_c23]KJS85415.1 MAG: cysteine synthase [Desulfosporosinus sp. BICA1-9]
MRKLLSGAHEAIGQTPMVNLSRLVKEYGVKGRIYAKLEYLNPGFSKKDRIALQIIEEAEKNGELHRGQPVVELTSGNTGTGLAIVCAVKGYKFIAVMSKGNSPERARMMRALGAQVVLIDQAPESPIGQVSGMDLALVEKEAIKIVKEQNAFRADQFHHIGNVHSHEYHTGEEMWEQCDGDIDAYLDFVGTAGTFIGCAKTLKRHKSDIRCYVVEPETASFLAGKPVSNPNHKIQGGGYCMELGFIEKELVSSYLSITNEEAIQMARSLAKTEGVFAGFSSGANVAAAIKLLSGAERNNSIALTINDSGLKYLSTDLYDA